MALVESRDVGIYPTDLCHNNSRGNKRGNELKHPEKGEGHGILSRRSLAIAGSSKLEQGRFILLHSELCSLVARLCYQIPLRHLPGVRPSLPSALPSFLLQPHFASLTLFQ